MPAVPAPITRKSVSSVFVMSLSAISGSAPSHEGLAESMTSAFDVDSDLLVLDEGEQPTRLAPAAATPVSAAPVRKLRREIPLLEVLSVPMVPSLCLMHVYDAALKLRSTHYEKIGPRTSPWYREYKNDSMTRKNNMYREKIAPRG